MAEQLLPIILGTVVLVVVFELIRRRLLRERHATFWIVLGGALVVSGLSPALTTMITEWLGFELPSNLVFFVSILVLFALALQFGTETSRLERDLRRLAEEVAVLRLQIERLQSPDDDEFNE